MILDFTVFWKVQISFFAFIYYLHTFIFYHLFYIISSSSCIVLELFSIAIINFVYLLNFQLMSFWLSKRFIYLFIYLFSICTTYMANRNIYNSTEYQHYSIINIIIVNIVIIIVSSSSSSSSIIIIIITSIIIFLIIFVQLLSLIS